MAKQSAEAAAVPGEPPAKLAKVATVDDVSAATGPAGPITIQCPAQVHSAPTPDNPHETGCSAMEGVEAGAAQLVSQTHAAP